MVMLQLTANSVLPQSNCYCIVHWLTWHLDFNRYLIYWKHLLFSSFVPACLYSGREAEKLAYITKYLKAVAMFRDYNNVSQDPDFTQVSSS